MELAVFAHETQPSEQAIAQLNEILSGDGEKGKDLPITDEELAARLRVRGNKVLETIAEVRQKRDQQDKLLASLEFQANIMRQGIDPQDVAAYVYDPRRDNRKPPKAKKAFGDYLNRSLRHWRQNVAPCYNGVVMKDGSRVDIEPVTPV